MIFTDTSTGKRYAIACAGFNEEGEEGLVQVIKAPNYDLGYHFQFIANSIDPLPVGLNFDSLDKIIKRYRKTFSSLRCVHALVLWDLEEFRIVDEFYGAAEFDDIEWPQEAILAIPF